MKKIYMLSLCLLLVGCGSRTNNLDLDSLTRETTIFVPQEAQPPQVQMEQTTQQQTSTERRGLQDIMGDNSGATAETTDRWAALQKDDETDPYESLEAYVETEAETVDYRIDFSGEETVDNRNTTAYDETQYTTSTYIPGTESASGNFGSSDLASLDSPELPTIYKERSAAAVYKDSTVIPDDHNFQKDAYGNYIIPMHFFRNISEYEKAMPFNEYGYIPYCYWYDNTGKILNELPQEYTEFRTYFMFGQYEDANDRRVNYTEAYVEGVNGGPGVRATQEAGPGADSNLLGPGAGQ